MGRTNHKQVRKGLGRVAPSNNCRHQRPQGHWAKKNWAGPASRTDPANQIWVPCSGASTGRKCRELCVPFPARLRPGSAPAFPTLTCAEVKAASPAERWHSSCRRTRGDVSPWGGWAARGRDGQPGGDGDAAHGGGRGWAVTPGWCTEQCSASLWRQPYLNWLQGGVAGVNTLR